jgi:hypothetical protein
VEQIPTQVEQIETQVEQIPQVEQNRHKSGADSNRHKSGADSTQLRCGFKHIKAKQIRHKSGAESNTLNTINQIQHKLNHIQSEDNLTH